MLGLIEYKAEDLINLSQAATILGVSYPTIFAIIERGELVPIRIADRKYLVKAEVEDLKKRREASRQGEKS
jgi:predicted DNA-binding transcriptional regulator AlpA